MTKLAQALVSIILPVFNGEKTLPSTVQSVLNQTYPHWELIIVNDGSTDGTETFLKGFKDNRIQVIHQPNAGVAIARNTGLAQAQGDYIAFIDADDRWLPEKLAIEVSTALNAPEKHCMVYSRYLAVDDQDTLLNLSPAYTEAGNLFETVLLKEGVVLPSTTLLHRSIIETVGGFDPSAYHEDQVFYLAVCKQFPAYPTQKRLVLYRQSTEGRCRRILSNYQVALDGQESVFQSVKPMLTSTEQQQFHQVLLQSLLFRFLMYGYLPHAKRLAAEHPTSQAKLSGKKGQLAAWSLALNVNLLFFVRLMVQRLYRLLPIQRFLLTEGRHP